MNFKDSNAWIDDEMIAFVIKDIISKLIINDGEIKYAYNRIAQNDVEISFIWENDTQKAFRTYKICTNNI
ncbi:hypothetical protein DP065_00485 [[Mycoplasma] anseris]|uniref:Uncharacterized protein n=1 Tax=[Mycoplasma] anseris TaxID=92400 RepID=A0A2Z4NCE9_9BACT|nr:hypothetical protein DP065_00485 [[Mycoplasma] anseris]